MKKIALISIIACLGLFASCKNEQKAEAAPQQDAVKEAAEATKDAAEKTAEEVKKEINKK